MRGVLIHGENIVLSRQHLDQLKVSLGVEGWQLVAPGDFSSRSSGFFERSFLEASTGILLEFFEKSDLTRFDREKLSFFLQGSDLPDALVFWFGFEVPGNNPLLKRLRRQEFEEKKFDLSPQIFKLVDAFFDHPDRAVSFGEILVSWPPREREEIFLVQLLIKRTRQIFWSLFGCSALVQLHPFVRQKTTQARARWADAGKLISLYESLINLDRDLKSREVDLESRILLLYERFVN